jgi:sugar phosphate permease
MNLGILTAKYNHLKNSKYSFRWFAYILGAIAFMFTIFHRVNAAVLAPYIIETFQVSGSTLGFMSGIYFYVYSFSQPIVGVLVDKLKPRRMLTLSLLTISLGTFLFAYAPSMIFIYLGRFFIGAGCAGIFIPTNWIINKYFAFEKRGFLLLILQFIGNLGSVLAAAPLANLISFLGWKGALIFIGLISVAIGILIWLTVRDNHSYSEESNHLSDSKEEEKKGWFSIVREVLAIPVIKYCLISTIVYAAMLSFQGLWVVPYLIDVFQVSKSSASSLATLIPMGYVIGLLLFSKLSDTSYGKYIYFGCTVMIISIYLFLTIYTGNIQPTFLPPLLFAIGIAHGATPYLLKIYALVLPKKNYGTALGALNVTPFIMTAIYQSFSGLLFDLFGGSDILYRSVQSYRFYFLFLTISLLVASWAVLNILTILRRDYTNKI